MSDNPEKKSSGMGPQKKPVVEKVAIVQGNGFRCMGRLAPDGTWRFLSDSKPIDGKVTVIQWLD